MKWFRSLTGVVLCCLLALTSGISEAGEITVSAAFSLKAPFEELGKIFERKYPGSRAVFNFASSGVLGRQIGSGAPVDVFAAASPKEIDALDSSGFIANGTRADFAGNVIVLITAAGSNIRPASADDLAGKDVGRIAIGNPAGVPAGRYTEEALRHSGLWDRLKAKMVYSENVRQVMDYVIRGEADAGVVFLTDAISRSSELKVVCELRAPDGKPAVYTIAGIKGAKNRAEAKIFIELVTSEEGKKVLRKHGFKTTY